MGPGAWTLPLARVDAAASRRVGARSRPGATFCRRAGRSLSRALVGAALKETRRERRRPATEKGAREAGVAREGGMGSERDLGGDAWCGGKANMHTERGEMQ